MGIVYDFSDNRDNENSYVKLPTEIAQLVTQLNDLGNSLRKQKKFAASEAAYKRAIAIIPNDAGLWANLGTAYYDKRDFNEAKRAYINALAIEPENEVARINYGMLLNSMQKWDEAEPWIKKTIEMFPNSIITKIDLGFMYLHSGQWDKGLPLYEERMNCNEFDVKYQKMPVPMWNGEDLNGKVLYVQAEQGIGDTLLFSRYMHWVKIKYPDATIKFCCADQLVNILWDFRHIIDFMPNGVPWADVGANYGIYLASLPLRHGSTPDNVYPDPGLIRKRVETQHTLAHCPIGDPTFPSRKIGICWTGNPKQASNADRSLPLNKILELASDPYNTFYSFQVGPGVQSLYDTGANELIADMSPYFLENGLVTTGNAMLEMDLIITCCTSMAHLAGSLGIPCWLLLCTESYWVWLKKGLTTNWYPSIKIFRQKKHNEWNEVFDEVKTELAKIPINRSN